MKFIVNSAYFQTKISEAIKAGVTEFKVSNDEVCFGHIGVQVHPVIRSGLNESFNSTYWQKISDFLKTIQEQPITVIVNFTTIEIFAESQFRILDEDPE